MRIIAIAVMVAFPAVVHAATISGKAPNGYTTIVVSGGEADSADSTTFSLAAAEARARLYLVKDGTLSAPVIVAVRAGGKLYSFDEARAKKVCKQSGARLLMGTRSSGTLNLGSVKVRAADGVGYLRRLLPSSKIDRSATATILNKNKCLPEGTGTTLGLATVSGSRALIAKGEKIKIKVSAEDQDSDGLIDILDIDKDNDGVLNAYDSESSSTSESSFNVFSNIKPEIQSSLNHYVAELTADQLDSLVERVTLAMQVAGDDDDVVELNCNGLTYCSNGGTGQTSGGEFPESADIDSDGYGTIVRGSTNDQQIQTGASSTSAIGAGDSFIQIINQGEADETQVPGMLNFVFNTTPAVESVTMGATTTAVSYPATVGTSTTPFSSPSGWDGVLNLSAYRPQRPGVSGAGEGEFVDIGNSLITIDIPNQPCDASNPGCSGAGPGNCAAAHYSESDALLSSDANGLRDDRADQDTNTADPEDNLVSFSIDLIGCLADQSITWNIGDKLAVDLQFRNSFGDNAAQKFYIIRN